MLPCRDDRSTPNRLNDFTPEIHARERGLEKYMSSTGRDVVSIVDALLQSDELYRGAWSRASATDGLSMRSKVLGVVAWTSVGMSASTRVGIGGTSWGTVGGGERDA
jgi:hypothetical protein